MQSLETKRDRELRPEELCRRLDPAQLPFATTAEVAPLAETVGQPRALDAIALGLDIASYGYNLFVAGTPGSGRESTVTDLLRRVAATRPTPPDWIYVYGFADPDRPRAIRLPAGRGARFARDMEELVNAVRREVPRVFEGEEYGRRQQALLAEVNARRGELLQELQAAARAREFAVELAQDGIMSVPLVNGQPLAPELFAALSDEQRRAIDERNRQVQELIAVTVRQGRQLERDGNARMTELDREVAALAIGPLLDEVREGYGDIPELSEHLQLVRADLMAHYRELRAPEEPPAGLPVAPHESFLTRYRVNLLIDNGAAQGAPLVVERFPTYYNLFGRVDYRAMLGAMVTDHRGIKAGALHRAAGGFLVLHAAEVLRQPLAWDALKRALLTRELRIENLGEQYSAVPTATLRPAPIPLDVKVVLIGSPMLYQLLYTVDEDFEELFKVRADFAADMRWDEANLGHYAAFVSRWVRENGLRHLDRTAVARVIEHGARLREHQQKLTTRMLEIANVVTEASYWAGRAERELVTATDIARAIEARHYRSNLVEERVHELIAEGTINVVTDGERTGQVNGIAVLRLGETDFGNPTRISARVSLGRGVVQSLEREVQLSGPLHTKGVLILSGYLAAQYAQETPLAASATLTFEQSYDEVEGDSASSAELYALLSALSGLPLRQGIAVTGSVDQQGRVQAVGGVTRKIEGFFTVCRLLPGGLTGGQGVIIPRANARHLMLNDEVVDAVRAGQFHIWVVDHVDEGIELLTGRQAGTPDASGTYPEGSVHLLVADRLRHFAEQLRAFGRPPAAAPAPNGHAAD